MPVRMSRQELTAAYKEAKYYVRLAGYEAEIRWQDEQRIEELTEHRFLRESAWVVLTSGFREETVRSVFPTLSNIFFGWKSATKIVANAGGCVKNAMMVFGHQGKINAITVIASEVAEMGWDPIRTGLIQEGCSFLERYPYVGPVTSRHLAKNLGMNVSKPDRHLVRLAEEAGYRSSDELCDVISATTGDRVGTVDIVLWRFSTLQDQAAELFRLLGKGLESSMGLGYNGNESI